MSGKDDRVEMVSDQGLEIPIQDVIYAFENVPIIARIEFVANLISANGGSTANAAFVPALAAAVDILTNIMEILDEHPEAASLPMRPRPFSSPKPG